MKLLLTSFAILCTVFASAQKIGVNTTIPLMQLDVRSSDSAALLLFNTQPFSDSEKTALYFRAGSNYTGAIKTHVQSAGNQYARLGFFTYSLSNANALKERMSILDNGYVGINTVSPTSNLEVDGTVRIVDGNQAAGNVLTSDANGSASWKAAASNSAFRGTASANTTVLTGGAYYTIPFSNTVYDQTGGYFDGVSYTATTSGVYHFDITCLWFLNVAGITYPLMMSLRTGGSTEIARHLSLIPAGQSSNFTTSISTDYFLTAGSSVYVTANQSSGVSQLVVGNVLTSFSGHRVY